MRSALAIRLLSALFITGALISEKAVHAGIFVGNPVGFRAADSVDFTPDTGGVPVDSVSVTAAAAAAPRPPCRVPST